MGAKSAQQIRTVEELITPLTYAEPLKIEGEHKYIYEVLVV
jgi:hypothetical protein